MSTVFPSISASNLLNQDGGKVIYSSTSALQVGGNMTVEIVDWSNLSLLENGQYGEFVVNRAFEIVRNYLEKHAIEKYDQSPFSESFFSSAFEDVLLEMEVDIDILSPAVFEMLLSEFTKIAKTYNRQSRGALVPGSSEYETRIRQVKLATIVIQETASNSQNFSDSQVLILLEFIYRFGINGNRYGLAIQTLYTSLPTGTLAKTYKMFVDYFDKSRHALPVLFVQIVSQEMLPVKYVFIDFIQNLYSKVIRIDPVTEKDVFNKHACMLIASMISCNFLDEFLTMLEFLLDRIDMVQLGRSPRFAKSAIDISQRFKHQSTELLDKFCGLLLNDNVILALDETNYNDHGSIILNLKVNQNELYKKHFANLSTEAKEKLKIIENTYFSYHKVISETKKFEKLEETFALMDQNGLNNLYESLERMAPVFQKFFKHQPNEASNTVIKLFNLIPKLINLSIRQPSRNLDADRFRVFIKLLELTFTGPDILERTTDTFSSILFFFTSRFNTSVRFNSNLNSCHQSVMELIRKLISAKKFFRSDRYRTNFYNFLELITPDSAESTMAGCLYEVLSSAEKKDLICLGVIQTTKTLKISFEPLFSHFISNEIKIYLEKHSQIPIDEYLEGLLVKVVKLAIKEKALQKSELELVNGIFNRYSKGPFSHE